MLKNRYRYLFFGALVLTLLGCDDSISWNNPYPQKSALSKVLYTSFPSAVVTLDPAKAYVETGLMVLLQVDEPPLQYHYLKRPFTLEPLILTEVPKPSYYDDSHVLLPHDVDRESIAYTSYDLHIKPGIYYASSPAFAKDTHGHYVYHHLTAKDLDDIHSLHDFHEQGKKELVAEDLAYAIKRLASPKVNSPIFGVMSEYILGLKKLRNDLKGLNKKGHFLDLRKWPLDGVKVIDDHHLRITLKGEYPQFLAWLTMGFFSPVPWEGDAFYSQPGMSARNLTFDWFPIGTGPYQLAEHNPNLRMTLKRNPNYRLDYYPNEGSPGDAEKGYLKAAGRQVPMLDQLTMTLEKESIPRWGKFLQGYYDASLVTGDNFDQAIHLNDKGEAQLSDDMKKQNIRLEVSVQPVVYYLAFNWLDPVVGGLDLSKRKLRQAIAIAINFDEYIQIFLSGQGRQGRGLIPPGIFGFRSMDKGLNPVLYREIHGKAERRSIEEAKQLLTAAGYPKGIDPKTGKPLRLQFDMAATGPTANAYFAWINKQFQQLGIDVQVRNTQYNRYQEKIRQGDCQIFLSNWMGDYPDPENFLFLLYGPNSIKLHGGVNVVNYQNKAYDRLFVKMKVTPDGPERQALIDQMRAIVYQDTPVVVSYYPTHMKLVHDWSMSAKSNALMSGYVKYYDLNPRKRWQSQNKWNKPNKTIVWSVLGVLLAGIVASLLLIRRQSRAKVMCRFDESEKGGV